MQACPHEHYRRPFFLLRLGAPRGGLSTAGLSLRSSCVTTFERSSASSTLPAPWLPFTGSCGSTHTAGQFLALKDKAMRCVHLLQPTLHTPMEERQGTASQLKTTSTQGNRRNTETEGVVTLGKVK